MVAISRVNPNFPVPGIDQSSRGFRDNFSTIKTEIEALQGKNIILVGDVNGNALIDSGGLDVVIETSLTPPIIPAFRVRGVDDTVINSDTVISASSGGGITIDHNTGSYYNNTTGEFVAPVTGLYNIFLNASVVDNSTAGSIIIRKNNSLVGTNILLYWSIPMPNSINNFGVSGYSMLNANDTVDAYVSTGSITFDNNDSWGITFIG